jgi:glycosyltransferase involved in cell wall biosynthesis
MIGDGEMRGAVESRARARGIEKYVVITGFQEEVRPYVAACDAMALCSLAVETFSLAAIESMAMCKPVVHSDVGGASEMIVPGLNGFLFPKGDTTKLADKLRVLACRATARQMGKNARERALALFSEKTMVDRYERLLLEVRPSGQHWDGYLARRDGQHDENQNRHV